MDTQTFSLQTILAYPFHFLVALSVIVFVHEFGHYWVARRCGVKVDAFSIGFGKEILGRTDRNGTRWKFCWIPLGGYVKFAGDTNAASFPEGSAESKEPAPGSFPATSVGRRALVVAAGPVANFLFAILIFAAILMTAGERVALPRIDEVMPKSPAEAAGIKPGDVVLSIDGAAVKSFSNIQETVLTSGGKQHVLELQRGSEKISISVTPTTQEVPDNFCSTIKIGLLGIRHIGTNDPAEFKKYGVVEALRRGVEKTWFVIETTMKYLGRVLSGRESPEQIGGLTSIAKGAGDAASSGLVPFLGFVALISVSIGLINLFPVPMLDGGHLVFYAFEALRGRPLGPRVQEWGMKVGIGVVLLIMFWGNFNDFVKVSLC
jgi:regulator of sigma E protease